MLLTDIFFFFNDTATTEIYTLSLHDALPISVGVAATGRSVMMRGSRIARWALARQLDVRAVAVAVVMAGLARSEEHTSEIQSRQYLVCRLLLEKKKISMIHIFLLRLFLLE